MMILGKRSKQVREKKRYFMVNRAIEFATKAHAGQLRKGTKRPYIVHPIEVGDIVSTMT